MNAPAPYLCERARAAIVSEAHVLGIEITLRCAEGTEDCYEALLDGAVETAEQRALVESIARRILELPVQNRLVVAPPDRPVRVEPLA